LTGSLKKAAHDADARYWAGLAVVFLFLSLDESASFHELTIMPLRQRLGAGGFLYSTWIVPAAAFVAVLGLVYLRFLARLPARTRWLIAASAVVYLSGTLGLEAVSGRHEDLHGFRNLTYAMLVTAEETLEMLGIVLFIHALLTYVAAEGEDVRLRFAAPDAAERSHRNRLEAVYRERSWGARSVRPPLAK
jgi:hypothetical protein